MADFSITGEVKLNSDPAQRSLSSWTVAAGNLIADFVKTAASALQTVAKSGMDYNASMESYLTNFKVMLGNEQLAAEKLEEIRQMAASTPFTLDDLTAGTQTLLQFGIAADDTTGVLKMLGDISLGNADKMQTLVRAYGKMSSAQKVTLENVNMMIDAGFNPLNQICDATGETMSDLYKRISDGKVSFSELEEAVKTATSAGGQFYNGMLEASQTFKGRLSTLQDNVSAFLGTLTDSLFEAGSDLLPWANDVILNLTDALKKDGPQAMLTAAVQIVGSLAQYLGDHADEIVDAGVQLLEGLCTGLENNLPALITAAAQLIAQFAAALIAHLPDILACGLSLMTTLVDAIVRGAENLAEAALACVAKLVGVWDGSRAEWGKIGLNIVEGIKNGILGAVHNLTSAVSNVVGSVVSTAKSLLGIHSPSKVFSEIGMQTCAGLAQGLTDNKTKVEDAAKQVVASVTDTATEITDGVTKVTETLTQVMLDGSQQQSQVITETSQQVVDGVSKTVKKVTAVAADGKTTVAQTMEDVKATVVSTTKDTQTALVDGVETMVEKTTKTLSDGSEQVESITTATGKEIIDGVERTVKTVTTKAADGTETVVKTIEDAGPQFATTGEALVAQLTDALNDSWKDVNTSLQTDVIGSIETLTKAITDGDLESLAKWTAGIFYGSLNDEQKTQINAFALDALNQLTSSLSGVCSNLVGLAANFIGQFVPAAGAAATAQGVLNTVMDANPVLAVISVIGLLVGALVNLAKNNKNVANGMKAVWSGVQDFLSVIFEGLLRAVALQIQGFVTLINGLIDTYNLVAKVWGGQIDRIRNPANDYADKLKAEREQRAKERKAQAAADKQQAALDAQYAKDAADAQQKQLEAKYAKKQADLEKAKLSSDSPGMLAAEQAVAKASYAQSLADLDKKLLDAAYEKASAEIEKSTTSDATKLAELEKKITESNSTLKMGDLERQLLEVEYQNSLKELESKYAKKTETSGKNSSSSPANSGRTSSDDTAKKLADMKAQYDQKLSDLKADYAAKQKELAAQYDQKLDRKDSQYQQKLDSTKASYDKQLASLKTEYDRKLASLEKELDKDPSSGSNASPALPDSTADKLADAVTDNTEAILSTNKALAEMVRQANTLVLSDNMAVSSRVAASGTARIAAAANNYTRQGDTTNITQNIYSKAQTAADLARETRWEADRAKAKKH